MKKDNIGQICYGNIIERYSLILLQDERRRSNEVELKFVESLVTRRFSILRDVQVQLPNL